MDIPGHFHRYLSGPSGSQYTLSNLRKLIVESRLRVSRPVDFNDPFDCRALFSTDGASLEDVIAFLEHRLFGGAREKSTNLLAELTDAARPDPAGYAGLMLRHVHESMARYLERIRMVCFCEPATGGEPANLLLWSYYADGHRGLCLVFDGRIVAAKAGNCLHKVDYRETYPSLMEFADHDWQRFHQVVLFSKSKQWEHEREWRLAIDVRFAEDGFALLPDRSLVAIVLGDRMPQADREAIFALAQTGPNGPIPVLQSRRHLEAYRLTFTQLVDTFPKSDDA